MDKHDRHGALPDGGCNSVSDWERASPATETPERLSQGGTGCAGAATSGQPLMPTDRGRPPEIRAHLGYGSVEPIRAGARRR
jgi:hypothetical protein